jgi:hypothetical protein
MNHFDYTAPGGVLNNHSTGFSDSGPNSPEIGGSIHIYFHHQGYSWLLRESNKNSSHGKVEVY